MLLTYHKETVSFPNFSEDIQSDIAELPGALETAGFRNGIYI